VLADVRVLIAGAGIDGELPEALVRERYNQLGAELVHQLQPDDVEPFRNLFDWHPSEATGLLAAAAIGTRGIAEMRDQGFAVTLGDRTPEIHALAADVVFDANNVAQQLRGTFSLDQAERAVRAATGRESEIDYERRKATMRVRSSAAKPTAPASPAALVDQLARIRSEAAHRGIDFITLRGPAERLNLPASRLPDLRRQLASHGMATTRRHFGECTRQADHTWWATLTD
jgi:hypothetical protein